MTLSGTTVTWRGLTFVGSRGDGSQPWIDTLEGWEDLPDARQDSDPRPQQHGRFDAEVFSDERVVMLTGACFSPADRDARLVELGAVMGFRTGPPEPLTIDHAGRVLTGFARLRRYKPTIGNGWAAGHFPFAVEWVCSDPLRYGAPITAVAGFPVAGGGLAYPLYTNRVVRTGGLWFGARSTSGRILLTNSGDADAWVSYTIDGPLAVEGCEIAVVGTGLLHRFQGAIPAGSTVLVEGATGTVLMDGYSDRSGQMTRMDPLVVPAHGSLELALIPLGSTSAAVLSASFMPGWW